MNSLHQEGRRRFPVHRPTRNPNRYRGSTCHPVRLDRRSILHFPRNYKSNHLVAERTGSEPQPRGSSAPKSPPNPSGDRAGKAGGSARQAGGTRHHGQWFYPGRNTLLRSDDNTTARLNFRSAHSLGNGRIIHLESVFAMNLQGLLGEPGPVPWQHLKRFLPGMPEKCRILPLA